LKEKPGAGAQKLATPKTGKKKFCEPKHFIRGEDRGQNEMGGKKWNTQSKGKILGRRRRPASSSNRGREPPGEGQGAWIERQKHKEPPARKTVYRQGGKEKSKDREKAGVKSAGKTLSPSSSPMRERKPEARKKGRKVNGANRGGRKEKTPSPVTVKKR